LEEEADSLMYPTGQIVEFAEFTESDFPIRMRALEPPYFKTEDGLLAWTPLPYITNKDFKEIYPILFYMRPKPKCMLLI